MGASTNKATDATALYERAKPFLWPLFLALVMVASVGMLFGVGRRVVASVSGSQHVGAVVENKFKDADDDIRRSRATRNTHWHVALRTDGGRRVNTDSTSDGLYSAVKPGTRVEVELTKRFHLIKAVSVHGHRYAYTVAGFWTLGAAPLALFLFVAMGVMLLQEIRKLRTAPKASGSRVSNSSPSVSVDSGWRCASDIDDPTIDLVHPTEGTISFCQKVEGNRLTIDVVERPSNYSARQSRAVIDKVFLIDLKGNVHRRDGYEVEFVYRSSTAPHATG